MTKVEAMQVMKEMKWAHNRLKEWVAEAAKVNGNTALYRDCLCGSGEMQFVEIGMIVAWPSRLAKLKKDEVMKVLERGEQRLKEMNAVHNRELNNMALCA